MDSSQFYRVLICASFILTLVGQVWSKGKCGKPSLTPEMEGYLMGGEEARQGEWPWMVAVMKINGEGNREHKCSGFLIDKIHVISAAHCFEENRASLYLAEVGNVHLTKGDLYSISRIAIHEGYRHGLLNHDIALLKLSREVDNDPGFNPVCLPPKNSLRNFVGKGTTVVGWGAKSYYDQAAHSTLKQLSALPVLPNSECSQAYREWIPSKLPNGITAAMVCAGFQNETGKDSCQGDSGGPLMLQQMNRWYAVGVVSFGYSCGRIEYPSVYTRITTYSSWIERQKKMDDYLSTPNIITEPVTIPPVTVSEMDDRLSTLNIITEPVTISPVPVSAPVGCGISLDRPSRQKRMIGGKNATQGAWPWVVAILKPERDGNLSLWCTGYLIDRKHVISAAVCFLRDKPGFPASGEEIEIRVGHVDWTKGDAYFISHGEFHHAFWYYGRTHSFSSYNIAVLTLSRDVDSPNFVPVCLHPYGSAVNLAGREATVVGWGPTERRPVVIPQQEQMDRQSNPYKYYPEDLKFLFKDGLSNKHLKQLSGLTILPDEMCYQGTTHSGRLCVEDHYKEGKDTCGATAGAPLMIRESNMRWYAVGIAGIDAKCDGSLTAVFMNVSNLGYVIEAGLKYRK